MTRETLILSFRFVFLVLLQVLVLNNIQLFGFINPNLYILFIFLYPLEKERGNFLWISFILGLCIDVFSNSGATNAFATVFISYFRLPILKLILNRHDIDYKLFKLQSEQFVKVFIYISLLTFIHHYLLFSLDYFSWKNIGTVLYKTLTAGIFTIILSILSLLLITKKNNA